MNGPSDGPLRSLTGLVYPLFTMLSDQSITAPSPRRYIAVAEQLLKFLERDGFATGGRLPPERDLATTMGVSRPTIREALLALELLGAVEVRRGDGVYVAKWGPRRRDSSSGRGSNGALDDLPGDLLRARAHVEPAVAALCAEHLAPGERIEMANLIGEAESLVPQVAQVASFVTLGLEFHSRLAPYCGNRILANTVRELVNVEAHPLWKIVNQQAMREPEARQNQILEHRQILDAIASNDAHQARHLMYEHIQRLSSRILDLD